VQTMGYFKEVERREATRYFPDVGNILHAPVGGVGSTSKFVPGDGDDGTKEQEEQERTRCQEWVSRG
jgi:hypothetical protein